MSAMIDGFASLGSAFHNLAGASDLSVLKQIPPPSEALGAAVVPELAEVPPLPPALTQDTFESSVIADVMEPAQAAEAQTANAQPSFFVRAGKQLSEAVSKLPFAPEAVDMVVELPEAMEGGNKIGELGKDIQKESQKLYGQIWNVPANPSPTTFY